MMDHTAACTLALPPTATTIGYTSPPHSPGVGRVGLDLWTVSVAVSALDNTHFAAVVEEVEDSLAGMPER